MADTLNVPPTDDFTAFTGLVSKQGEHLAPMVAWAGKECSDTDGLNGLLSAVKPIVPEVAQLLGGKLKQCQIGMGTVKDKVTTVDKELRSEDEKNATAIAKVIPDSPGISFDVSSVPGSSTLGNFTDEAVNLKAPDKPKTISKGLVGTLAAKHGISVDGSDKKGTGGGGLIWIADKAYKMVTGHSFIEQLFKPLLGDWDQLMYLHDAYDTLGDACYTVAGTLRKGSWKLGSEWNGDTAEAFDAYMFRWTMGLGGVGDAAKEFAKVCKEVYDLVVDAVKIIVSEIDSLIANEITELAKEAAKTVEGDVAIEAIGLGPEDPVADVVAAAWTGYRAIKIYKRVKAVLSAVNKIYTVYNGIKKTVEKVSEAKKQLESLLSDNSPWPTAGSLISDVEQRGFDFEKDGSWDPTAGVARVAMLPSAT
ncbi:hypothetical protein ACFYXQ_17235 [Nocardia jiangxiensis]|uniref:Excreted virulence factor EspC, type VII ESX diderm n=1 Tax=Nocardia jiangxiensis TaxID=282685 RepID=A0ABW6RZP4_9NOCA